jgi:hypothetical protein
LPRIPWTSLCVASAVPLEFDFGMTPSDTAATRKTQSQKSAMRVDLGQTTESLAGQPAAVGNLTGWRANISMTSMSETWRKSE